MSSLNENVVANEFDERNANDEASNKKLYQRNILIFLCCIIIAFVIWCYASQLEDPIVKQLLQIEFVLQGGEKTESITPAVYQWYYGTESAFATLEDSTLSGVKKTTIVVNKSKFEGGDTYVINLDAIAIKNSNGKSNHIIYRIDTDDEILLKLIYALPSDK